MFIERIKMTSLFVLTCLAVIVHSFFVLDSTEFLSYPKELSEKNLFDINENTFKDKHCESLSLDFTDDVINFLESNTIEIPFYIDYGGFSLVKLSEREIGNHILKVCEDYPNIDKSLVKAIVFHESGYCPDAVSSDGSTVGLMQLSPYWNSARAKKLGVTNFYDPYSNILVGVDLLNEFYEKTGDIIYAMMLYGMNHEDAKKAHAEGRVPKPIGDIFNIARNFKIEGF